MLTERGYSEKALVYVCDFCGSAVLIIDFPQGTLDEVDRYSTAHLVDKGTTICFECLPKAGYTLSTMAWKIISAQLPYFANPFGDTVGPQDETPPF